MRKAKQKTGRVLLPQTTTGVQCKARQSNKIIHLAEKAPQMI
jgi:hypothetical protein